uniref:LON peptidase N-terminal domain and ring finger 2 n=1 Tax=Xenopus tropicalis TaxID=8364 RepID=A0A803JEZ7_XENTR
MEVGSVQHTDPFPPAPPGLCSEMLGVAEESYRAGNFELAAEIYGSQLEEQPQRFLWLRKGDALALAGRVTDALDCYTRAAMLSQLRPEELGVLVGSIARNIREKELGLPCAQREPGTAHPQYSVSPYSAPPAEPTPISDIFSCPMCRLLLLDPVTLLCGHSVCKRCLRAQEPLQCSQCGDKLKGKAEWPGVSLMDSKVNVVLGNLLQKWLKEETKVRRLSVEGELLRESSNLMGAMEKYSAALELTPCDSWLAAERAELYLAMKNYNQAISDADTVCKKEPLSHKIICEMLFPAFENVQASLGTPLRALTSHTRLKPSLTNSNTCTEDFSLPGCSKDSKFQITKSFVESDIFVMEEFKDEPVSCMLPHSKAEESLGNVLVSLPGASLKRKLNSSEDYQSATAKVRKTGAESKCEQSATKLVLRDIPVALVDACDFECSLCMRLFYEPVATPCGHTFCLKCLERCLDHNPHCPLCKEDLAQYLAYRAYKKTLLTEELITRYLPEELTERKKIYDEEMKELSNLHKDVPIFVCTMAFPTIPCPLHVFEPRYRLMIRRSMETGTKQFGMCIADDLKGFADYGCMLQVRDVKFFPDGRSVVDTIGLNRFKVLSHGQRDGYNTANIEYLEDKKMEGQEYEELLVLHNSVYDQALGWFTSLKDNMKSQILSHFGQMPSKESDPQNGENGPAWCWWMLAVLPLESKAQLTILAMTSLKDRLHAIKRILIFVTRKRAR